MKDLRNSVVQVDKSGRMSTKCRLVRQPSYSVDVLLHECATNEGWKVEDPDEPRGPHG
jgi:hypothetical protein